MSQVHELKSWPAFFRAIVSGERAHELRRNDRGFAVGDVLRLREYDPACGAYTGAVCDVRVSSITSADQPCAVSDIGLHRDFCIMTVKVLAEPRSAELASAGRTAASDYQRR